MSGNSGACSSGGSKAEKSDFQHNEAREAAGEEQEESLPAAGEGVPGQLSLHRVHTELQASQIP